MNWHRLVFTFCLASAAAFAQVPSRVGYHGLLLRMDGTPERGMVTVRFSIHDAETAGMELWTETQSLLLTDGLYATQLGQVTALPSTVFDAPARFLQLSVNGTALSPRQRFGSVPFALVAGSVSGGPVNASSVRINNVPVVAINTATACNGGDVAKWNGSSWGCGAPAIATDGGTVTYSTLAGGGLELNASAFSLLRSCSNGQTMFWNGSAWGCGGTRGGLGVCADGEVLKYNTASAGWSCSSAGVSAVSATSPLLASGTGAVSLSLSTVPVSLGGTGANMSATGGAGHFVRQTAVGGPFTTSPFSAAELPAHQHSASDVTSGTLTLARGGTGANMSTTGGTGHLVRQTAAGGALSTAPLSASELPSHQHAASDMTSGTLSQARGGTGIATTPADGTFLRSNGGVWQASPLVTGDVPPGSPSYLQNQSVVSQSASFSISGSGVLRSLSATNTLSVGISAAPTNAAMQVVGAGIPALRVGAGQPLFLNSGFPSVTFNGRPDSTGASVITEGGHVAQVIQNPTNGTLEFWLSDGAGTVGSTLNRIPVLELTPRGHVPCPAGFPASCGGVTGGFSGPTLRLANGRLTTGWDLDVTHWDGTTAKAIIKKYWNGTEFDSLYVGATSTGLANTSMAAMVFNAGGGGRIRFGRGANSGESLSFEFAALSEQWLRVNSGCVINSSGAQIAGTCPSDARLKKDVLPLSPTLQSLAQLEPVSFAYRSKEFGFLSENSGRDIGLIAQQVEQVMPELVEHDANGFRRVHYERLPVLSLQAIRELKERGDAHEKELAEARARMSTLEGENRELRARLEAIEKALAAKR